MANKKYIGITVGPIFDTINLTSSPAALWAASYMFSSLVKSICEVLTEEYDVKCSDIISPYYDKEAEILNKNDAVGLFHDRIIFCAENFEFKNIEEVREKAIKKVFDAFFAAENECGDCKENQTYLYLKQCIKIAAAKFEADNPILGSGKILDSLELAKPFVFAEEMNPILALFTNADNNAGSEEGDARKTGKNEAIKKLTESFDSFQLRKDNDKKVLKSLYDIVHTGDGMKKYKYYAIVRSDADNMSKIISSLNADKIRDFSKACLEYCSEIAEEAALFDGVAIYSGGDDLLAILPCESASGKNVFDFVKRANEIFGGKFQAYKQPTSLSFGITIAYYKFPLYEALEDSANLLFSTAKSLKNCSALRIQKHSGQSVGLVVCNDALNKLRQFMSEARSNDDELLLSAMHKLNLFKKAFEKADDMQTVENLFVNTFDAASHAGNSFVHTTLPDMFWFIKNENGIYAIDSDGVKKDESVLIMHYVLRCLKFFVEKDGRDE